LSVTVGQSTNLTLTAAAEVAESMVSVLGLEAVSDHPITNQAADEKSILSISVLAIECSLFLPVRVPGVNV